MDQATAYVQQNKGMLSTVLFLALFIGLIYVVYTYLYPTRQAGHVTFLHGEADARKPVPIKGKVPAIYTGGDFTLSFWVYIDDYNYLASRSKFLFALSPEHITTTTKSPLVGLLTPLTNGLMVRAHTAKSGAAPAPATSAPQATGVAAPDVTVEANLQAVLSQQSSMTMFQDALGEPCDVKEVPLQRWVCITIVSSGRVLDVYLDGKLTRSCVLDNVVHVPRSPLKLRLGENGGFGGRYSSVQMWGSQLTPDAIYGLYMQGPTSQQHNIFTGLANLFDLNVTFTGSAPGQPANTVAPFNPFASLKADAQSAYASASGEVSSLYNQSTAMISRY
jgi:hypothetical protein